MGNNTNIKKQQPVTVLNQDGTGGILFICEHASPYIPEVYNNLGLADEHLRSHIVWDPGALDLATKLSNEFDSPLIAGTISRLVYDCNRPPDEQSAIPEKSEVIEIPGNRNLRQDQRFDRTNAVYIPFCQAVNDAIENYKPNAIVTIHSYTPIYFGKTRDVEVGILHDEDTRLADAMLAEATHIDRVVRRNEPYGPQDGVTHSLQKHAISRGIPNVMIEVRNDLLQSNDKIQQISDQLKQLLKKACEGLND